MGNAVDHDLSRRRAVLLAYPLRSRQAAALKLADPVARSPTGRGRPWLWRAREPLLNFPTR
jgi:hypothetical protein